MSNQTEVKRGRGRPSNFPGIKTVPFLAKIPAETREMVTTLAERREEPIGVTLDRMIRRAFAEANRSRKPAAPSAS
jgi:hypothetical protein